MAGPKVLVLGHSGTEGYGLAGRTAAWPGLVEERLLALGTPCDVVAVPLFPVGPRAVSYAVRQVELHEPDIVVLSLNAYPCSIAMVSARVRRLFGNKAHRFFTRVERQFRRAANPNSGPVSKRIHRSGRGIAHLLIGPETIATVGEVVDVYSEILRELARREGIQVVALREVPFSPAIRQESPSAYQTALELQRRLDPVIKEHRFETVVPDGFEDGGAEDLWMPDGIHLSAAGNAAYAASLARTLREVVSFGYGRGTDPLP